MDPTRYPMPVQAILISQQTWQTFCRNFPNAAQWLILQLDLQHYQLPSLTPAGEPVVFTLSDGDAAYECPGAG